jgi:hypothetical protein
MASSIESLCAAASRLASASVSSDRVNINKKLGRVLINWSDADQGALNVRCIPQAAEKRTSREVRVAPGGDLAAFIVNRSCEAVMPTLPGDQDVSHDQLVVIVVVMELDHFPRIDDPCIRNGKSGTRSERI